MATQTTRHVELTLSRESKSPADALLELSEKCKELQIASFDVYGDGQLSSEKSYLRQFESEVGSELGLEDGVFMCSGVMAQDIVLALYGRIDSEPGGRFVCHYSSHILLHEQGGYSSLLKMHPIVVPKDETLLCQQPLTYSVMAPLIDAAVAPSCVIVECPHREIGGKLTPWEDLVAISAHCRRRGVPLHMDGARLWEAAAGYGKTHAELCALFDSVYVSFYKGLGGLTGAMLLGSASFIREARVWQRRLGGTLFTYLPYSVSSWAAFRDNKYTFHNRLDNMQRIAECLTSLFSNEAAANEANDFLPLNRRSLVRFDPPVPQVPLVHLYIRCSPEMAMEVKRKSEMESGVSCFSRVRAGLVHEGIEECYIEFNVGPLNGALELSVWEKGWVCFLKNLREALALKS